MNLFFLIWGSILEWKSFLGDYRGNLPFNSKHVLLLKIKLGMDLFFGVWTIFEKCVNQISLLKILILCPLH